MEWRHHELFSYNGRQRGKQQQRKVLAQKNSAPHRVMSNMWKPAHISGTKKINWGFKVFLTSVMSREELLQLASSFKSNLGLKLGLGGCLEDSLSNPINIFLNLSGSFFWCLKSSSGSKQAVDVLELAVVFYRCWNTYHKLSGLKPHRFALLWFCRSEVWPESLAEIRVLAGCSFLEF